MRIPALFPLLLSALLAAGARPAAADWTSLVVGQPGPDAPTAFADAFHAAAALERGSVPLRDVLRDAPLNAFRAALAAPSGAPGLILFYSGAAEPARLALRDGSVALDEVLAEAARAGVRQLVLLIEDCPTPRAEAPRPVALPDPPAGLEMLAITSAGGQPACAPGARLTDRLEALAGADSIGGDLRAALGDLPQQGAVPGPVTLVERPAPEPEEVVEYLPDDVVLLDLGDGAEGEASEEVRLPARVPESPAPAGGGTPVITLASLPAQQIAARPLGAGRPEPSIIVGVIEGVTDAAFEPDAGEQTDGAALAWDDLAARRALRENSPALFETLLASGALDPPEDVLAVALQQELQRMGCYRAGIDGLWGPGSRGAARSYLDEADIAQPPAPEPTIELFRLILRFDDVECAVPQAPAPAATAPSRPATTTTRTRQAPAPAPQPQPQPAAPSSGGGFGSGNFGGVFR